MFNLNTRSRQVVSLRAAITRRRLSLSCITLAAMLTGSLSAAYAVECRSEKGAGSPWAWREIDGKRCWYLGKPGMDKKLLRWGASTDTPVESRNSAAPKNTSGAKSSAAKAAAKSKAATSSTRSPSLINDYAEREALLYTYWPPLVVPPADVSSERSSTPRAKRL